MKTRACKEKSQGENSFSIDTTFVLFFLALEFGQTIGTFALDSVFLALTLLTIAILPYFLLSDEKPNFSKWFLGRSIIAGLAFLIGAMFKQTLGVFLPETFRFLPMSLLIVAAMLSCYVQYYSFFKFRLAK